MAERIANDLGTFEGDINDYSSNYQNLTNHFGDMVDHMNALNNMWEGEAHNGFLQTFETDKDKILQMIEDFKQILDELRYAHRQYAECENSVAGLIDQMPV